MAVSQHSAPARSHQATATMSALESAMVTATASHEPKAQPERLTYAEARADLDARARAGQTVQGRNSKGRFTRGVKVFTTTKAPAKSADEMLMRLFPRWRGDFGAPAVSSAPKSRGPTPASARVLVGA